MRTRDYKQQFVDCFLKSVLAGIFISIACVTYLMCSDKVIGSILFSVGLFCVFIFKANLFTGKICNLSKTNIGEICLTFAGNLIGVLFCALAIKASGIKFAVDINTLVETKASRDLIQTFILAIFCNIMIYIAVYGWNNCKDGISKWFSVIIAVTVFVLCGFEHSIADLFYLCYYGISINIDVKFILVIILGNIVGALFMQGLLYKKNKN